jgi:FkbH-like protein
MNPLKYPNYFEILEKINNSNNNNFSKIKIKALFNFNSFYLENFIQYYLLKINCRANFLKTDFDQIEQQLNNFNDRNLDFIILGNDIAFLKKKNIVLNDYFKRLENQIKALKVIKEANKNIKIIIFNLTESLSTDQNLKIIKFNNILRKLVEKNHLYYFNINKIFKKIKYKHYYNFKNHEQSKILYSENSANEIGNHLSQFIINIISPRKKCLVLDLDDTLWGGIVGEAGYRNIKIDKLDAEGKYFYNFQKYIKELSRKGIILAIASKNNFNDVKKCFEYNKTKMPLKLDDFSCIRVNWNEKFINLNEISKDLNIGKDSMVFFDNSVFEREQMKKFNSSISVIDVPENPKYYVQSLDDSHYFSSNSLLNEDKNKKYQYDILNKAKIYKKNFNTNLQFLKSLRMQINISSINPKNFKRCVQMINKTNQFNLTTKRFNEIQFRNYLKINKTENFVISLKDKFGDHGITGLVVALIEKKTASLRIFLLSCRILGRKVEEYLLNELIFQLKKKGIEKIKGIYFKTKKNYPFENFYINNRFIKENKNSFLFNVNKYKKNQKKIFLIKYENK